MPTDGRRDDQTPLEALTPPPSWWSRSPSPPVCGGGASEGTSAASPALAVARRPGESELRAERLKLIAGVRETLRARHYSRRTEKAYVGWIARFLCALPRDLLPQQTDVGQVRSFLSRLATQGRVAASTQNQAFSALLFLFREVLKRDLERLDQVDRAKRPTRLPQVLTRPEVSTILGHLRGTLWLMASLMYGSGLRLLECCRLRVKDVDFARHEITVRDGKGAKDRVTMLPARLVDPLRRHLERTRRFHQQDLSEGLGAVALPHAFERKDPTAGRQWAWQWVFPAQRLHFDDTTGERHRHHLHESVMQRAFKGAVQASGIAKRASCHTLRHCAGSRIMPGSGVRARPTWLAA